MTAPARAFAGDPTVPERGRCTVSEVIVVLVH